MEPRLILNIGNTRVNFAICKDGNLSALSSFPTPVLIAAAETENLPSLLQPYTALPCAAACVVPAAATALRQLWPADRLLFVTADAIPGLDLSLVDPTTVGADRLANAVAALQLYSPPVIVLDCGTAITTEVVDGERRFRGGAILAGRRLQRRALSQGTGQLPEIAMATDEPSAIGGNTTGAILAGTDLGIIGAVQLILDRTRVELNAPECPVIALGGDADFFVRHIPGITLGPQDLTLRGIVRIAAESGGS
jgi:type III pantothenate kinase